MQTFDFFDMIVCINLFKRKDRWELALKEFNKLGIEDRVFRISAIEKENAAYGCHLSHAKSLQFAKDLEAENILIFEDDVEFFPNAVENLNQALVELPPDWDMLYLGANLDRYPAYQISDHLAKLEGAFATHAYAINSRMYDILIRVNQDNNIIHNDVYYSDHVIPYHNCYITLPLVAGQRDSYSDIQKTVMSSNAMFQERLDRNLVRWKK